MISPTLSNLFLPLVYCSQLMYLLTNAVTEGEHPLLLLTVEFALSCSQALIFLIFTFAQWMMIVVRENNRISCWSFLLLKGRSSS